MSNQLCYKCKRPITGAEICDEGRLRCGVCGASDERCQNPSDAMVVLQSGSFNTFMAKHRKAGQELHWFRLMDRMNEEAAKSD